MLVKFNSSGARVWATYYGGAGDESCGGAIDQSGNVYLFGSSSSTTGIATAGSFKTTKSGASGSRDAYIAKFNGAGVLQWGTYFGNIGEESAASVATDAAGNIYMSGWLSNLSSGGISTTGAHQPYFGGGAMDGFIAKFSSTGFIRWSSYYGGGGDDQCGNVAVTSTGKVYVSGYTFSSDAIATTGAYQDTINGDRDGFLAEFDTAGVRIWSTYYGGERQDGAQMFVDEPGNIYLAGNTLSATNIASVGAYDTTSDTSWSQAYLVKFGFPTAPSTSVATHPAIKMKAYPNPTSGMLHLQAELPNKDEHVFVMLTDLQGRVIREQPATIVNGALSQDIWVSDNVASGTYWLSVRGERIYEVLPIKIER